MKERVAAAGESHRSQSRADGIIHDLDYTLERHLIPRAHVHGVAEVAVDVAAVADVQLEMQRSGGGTAGNDVVDDRALRGGVNLPPPVSAPLADHCHAQGIGTE